MLRVIEGPRKKTPDHKKLHTNAALRSMERWQDTKCRADAIKAVNHGVRAVVLHRSDMKDMIDARHYSTCASSCGSLSHS
jgi:hypothetical protein